MKKMLLVLLVFCWPLSSLALNVTNLYQVELSVASQTDDTKEQAIKDGFAQVLMKVSGDPKILDNPLVRVNLRRADYYVQDYSYSSASTNSSSYTIVINYSEPDVKRLLKKAGEQYWGQSRPLLLVWLAVTDENNNTQIIDSESDNTSFAKMAQIGKRIGLPLLFPLMDMDDINQISPEDINNKSLTVLNNAAKRYSPDGLLIGSVKISDGAIDGEWELIVGQNKWDWSITDTTMDSMANGIVNMVSQTLAKYYVVKAGKTVSLNMNVDKISQRSDLLRLVSEIKQLGSVKRVAVASISGDQVVLAVLARGDLDSFEQNMAINRKLVLKSQDNLNNKLFYEWAQ